MKHRLSILLPVAFVFCIYDANAQINTFDLSKYKTADYARQMLTVSGDVSGNYSENKSDEGSDNYNKNFFPNLDLEYLSFKNSRKRQQETSISLRLKPNDYSYNSSSTSSPNYYNYSRDITNHSIANLNFYSINRYYFRTNSFLEINTSGGVDAGYSKRENKHVGNNTTNDQNSSHRRLNSNFSLPVRIGHGRLENIEDARLATFILEDLQKNNQLSKNISDEDILILAEKVTQLKNKRHFDSRKRRIFEIQSLDSFLRNNDYSESQNAVYFSSLIDNWEYANNPMRVSGKRFSVGFGPNIVYSIENQLSFQKWHSYMWGLGVNFVGEIEKPISLQWQRSLNFTAGYNKNHDIETSGSNTTESKSDFYEDIIYLYCSYGIGFYPDSRSFHQISLNPKIQKSWQDWNIDSSIPDKDDLNYGIFLNLSGYIYISQRFHINYSLNSGYRERKSEYTDLKSKYSNFNTSFNLSCSYSIF